MTVDKRALIDEISDALLVNREYALGLITLLNQEDSELKSLATLPIDKFESVYSSRFNIQRDVMKNRDVTYLDAFRATIEQTLAVKDSVKEVNVLQVKDEKGKGFVVFVTDSKLMLGVLPTL
ncbi:hypothetical protein LRP50_09340 [Enterovibrio sp. ZSDZ42]|uniref:DUF2294 domain-containing protein n=1 Tax=Enterovibrio gelatinilyticus TaxID=2899819 RepID=A0ABT5QZ78_9GAMM|nr:hypothetical protein [Enterovibrio sp. ZSDZ42]MDD1793328.1 hypothetical protein [Enterovibrio sp. ZSDZ42]